MLPLLRALCALRWQPALTAALCRMAEAQQDAPRLLSELFAAPSEAEPLAIQQAAAQQAAALLQQRAAAAARSKKAAGQQGECIAMEWCLGTSQGAALSLHWAPTEACAVRCSMLPLISRAVAAGRPTSPLAAGEAGMLLLARCLAALCHPNRGVREAAVQCAQACTKLAQPAPGSGLSGAEPCRLACLAFSQLCQ